MNTKKRLLIIYHSGAGSTKTIAEIYCQKLSPLYRVEISSINLEYDYKKLSGYDFFIFAFPTYHCEPSHSMMEFINNMPVFKESKEAFALTTCGLYSGNTLRKFIKKCTEKNIIIRGCCSYRAPATDGALLLPPIPMMFSYERKVAKKIEADIQEVKKIIETNVKSIKCPPFKLYTILNYPNKVLGEAKKHNFKIMEEYCAKCYKCMNNCIRNCWETKKSYPEHENVNCEYCFRCVHHCPKEAIILSERTRKRPKLNEKFYHKLKEIIMNEV
ncbi:4Fe-4S ferredoxin, iron-sulfur binding domain protein [Alkaliphilus metalliredigens QYMF]|uniref:4Fe-4S ferredoxin, iron-sulfur binding domain protein n=1 Tax=Alkaliphilus metalliredigens (strain QYMF) TaxID=293826 RepID=A6TN61_ALKMQ|nr:EFR1 family ferrodoxin [Alkaliphilus metalliredigens]ABR47629.1 4Fe-4S ferredoxin, iron-sulfur binding domain protein [Alkaliphilus metalliredigens QYMF]